MRKRHVFVPELAFSTLALASALGVACAPDWSLDDGLVTAPRVLAVRGDPAEAKPGASIEYTAFVALPPGAGTEPSLAWSFCTAPKPPTENNVVSSACLDGASLVAAGSGEFVTAATPRDACSLFGPDTPPGGFRPRDPDVTGGYYQPLRADLAGAAPVFHLARLLCDLGMAPADIASEFAAAYVPNANPHLLPLTAAVGGAATSLDAIPAGARVRLEVSWPPEDAESYAYFDRAAQLVTTKRESLRVAWYTSGGRLDAATTGRAENDPATNSANTWTAPDAAGSTSLWLVLRDSRGGVDFAHYDVVVTP
jgi:hypothetical protein